MKKIFILFFVVILIPLSVSAQSSMTDDQIIQFILKENDAGTSQAQIVTKLMQRGVKIDQIRRVRQKYEKMYKDDEGLGVVDATKNPEDRLRTNNTKTKSKAKARSKISTSKDDEDYDFEEFTPQFRIKDGRDKKKDAKSSSSSGIAFDETNDEWWEMQDELLEIIPDTAYLYELLIADKKKKKKEGFWT